jgi:hypothetical protein
VNTQADLDTDALIDLAVDHLAKHSEVTRYADDTRFAYTETQHPGTVFVVTDDDMEGLGARLARDDVSAYSHWCADTIVDVVTAEAVVKSMPELRTTGLDVNALREEAGAAGDYMTCAACDHIAQEIRALL